MACDRPNRSRWSDIVLYYPNGELWTHFRRAAARKCELWPGGIMRANEINAFGPGVWAAALSQVRESLSFPHPFTGAGYGQPPGALQQAPAHPDSPIPYDAALMS